MFAARRPPLGRVACGVGLLLGGPPDRSGLAADLLGWVPMSVHLVGGGKRPEAWPDVYGRFVVEAGEFAARFRGASQPRIGIVAVRDGDQEEHAAYFVGALTAAAADPSVEGAPASLEPVVIALQEGEVLAEDALEGLDAVLVGGGLTPAYRDAVVPRAAELRAMVAAGMPYLGFSAGAMISPDAAIVGGWRIGGVEVCPEDSSEDLDDVSVHEGIGLLDVSVDAHAAQWGNLSRLVAAVEAGLVVGGVAIDEDTVLVVGDNGLVPAGLGTVWRAFPGEDGVVVGTMA